MNSDPLASRRRAELRSEQTGNSADQSLVGLTTAVATSVSGVYMATRSVVVTALAAGLIAALACVSLRRSRRTR